MALWFWLAAVGVAVILENLHQDIIATISHQDQGEQFKCRKTYGRNCQKYEKRAAQESGILGDFKDRGLLSCYCKSYMQSTLQGSRPLAYLVWRDAYFFICKIAVSLFLMITGALLLPKTDPPKKSAARLLRAGIVLVVTSAFYYVCYGVSNGDAISVFGFWGKVFKTRIITPLWYLYLYFGLLCLLPILQKMVKALNKRDLQWVIFLSAGILGTIPLIHTFIPSFGIAEEFTCVLFSSYIGIFLCEYYIERYVTVDRTLFWLSTVFFALSIGFQTVATYYFYQVNQTNYLLLDNRTFITITGASACFYMMVKYLYSKISLGSVLENVVTYVGGLTFGIYLLSDLMIHVTRPIYGMLCGHVHVVAAIIIWEVFIFSVCAMITASLKQIPFLKKWL